MEIKGTKLFDGFVFLGKEFLDKRSSVLSLNNLKDIDPNTIPEGFRVYVKEVKQWYQYDADFHSEMTGHWRTSEGMEEIDSEEFIYAIVDSEGKILSGIKVDGTVYNPTLETGNAVFSSMNVDEFLWAVVDMNQLILFGIKKDGSLYAPKGVPDEVEERFNQLSALTVLTNTDNWLFAFVDPTDTVVWGIQLDGTIYQGKGIPDDVKAEFKKVWGRLSDFDELQVLENDGVWLFAITDSEGKVLWGIEANGNIYQGLGIPEETKKELSDIKSRMKELAGLQVLENTDNWLYAIQDTEGSILWGIEPDGTIYQGKGIPEDAKEWLQQLTDLGYKVIQNEQYLYAICDEADNVLFGIDYKGRSVVNAITGIGTVEVVETDKYVYAIYDSTGNMLFAILKDGTCWMSKFDGESASDIANGYLSGLDDEEFIHIVRDSEGYIVLGVRWDGSIYIPKGMSEDAKLYFKQVDKRFADVEADIDYLKKHGKDWSDEADLWLPVPRVCARVEIEGTIPTSKYIPVEGRLTYSDFDGNSFTKKILWNIQGNISSGFDKKNYSIDLLSEDDEEFTVQFGTWVPQDSFHLKAHYSDFWKTRAMCVYRLAELISQYRPYYNRRPWDKIFGAATQQTADALKGGIGEVDQDMRDGALGRPDGFPFMLYINGKPYGIYTWNIKKSKDNYHITKNDDTGAQMFFGDYMTGVFQRLNYDYWAIVDWDVQLVNGAGDARSAVITSYSSSNGAHAVMESAGVEGMTLSITNSSTTYTYPVYYNGAPVTAENTWAAGDCVYIKREGTSPDYHFNLVKRERWAEDTPYAVNQIVYDPETFDYEVNGNISSVTIRRVFRLQVSSNTTFAGIEYDDETGFAYQTVYYIDEETGQQMTRRGGKISPYYNSLRPSQICWRHLEVRNPKKTVVRYPLGKQDGVMQYQYEYYNYDSPADFAYSGVYEYTHEIISSDMISEKNLTKLIATGETKAFSKKEYNRSVNTRANLEKYSRVIPVLRTTLTPRNLFDWGFMGDEATLENYQEIWDALTTSQQATLTNHVKKQIFTEHHDVDHAIDFFLVYNATNYYDSITHNTLYTTYDGKKVVPNLYDTDIALGMSSTYTNSFPAVPSGVLNAGDATFVGWLYRYYIDEIKQRWKEYRDAGVISTASFSKLVYDLTDSIGVENYKTELKLWTQPGYRTPVYWRMPAGSLTAITNKSGEFKSWGYNEDNNNYASMPAALKALYDADPSSVEYDPERQYVSANGTTETMYCTITDGDTVHWYQCTANCKGQNPTETYTCGSPTSGGVIDSPKRTIKWFEQRLAYLDTLWAYEPAPDPGADSSIPSSVIDDIING